MVVEVVVLVMKVMVPDRKEKVLPQVTPFLLTLDLTVMVGKDFQFLLYQEVYSHLQFLLQVILPIKRCLMVQLTQPQDGHLVLITQEVEEDLPVEVEKQFQEGDPEDEEEQAWKPGRPSSNPASLSYVPLLSVVLRRLLSA